MTDAQFVKSFSMMIAGFVILTVLLATLGIFIGGGLDDELRRMRGVFGEPAIMERIEPVGQFAVGEPPTRESAQDTGAGVAGLDSGEAVYQSACAVCHGTGVAGAPKFGDDAAWASRTSQGIEVLNDHAINGYTGEAGVMPPKGGNTALSDDQVKAAVAYMTGAPEPSLGDGEAAAGEAAEETTNVADTGAESAASGIDGASVYQSACVACHTAGVAGAPKLGDAGAWAERTSQGAEVLYEHAVQGYQGSAGYMPAKGGNMALSDDEVRAAVDYMVSEIP